MKKLRFDAIMVAVIDICFVAIVVINICIIYKDIVDRNTLKSMDIEIAKRRGAKKTITIIGNPKAFMIIKPCENQDPPINCYEYYFTINNGDESKTPDTVSKDANCTFAGQDKESGEKCSRIREVRLAPGHIVWRDSKFLWCEKRKKEISAKIYNAAGVEIDSNALVNPSDDGMFLSVSGYLKDPNDLFFKSFPFVVVLENGEKLKVSS